nr:MAG TPA: hypothetical protein [Caudoviricetes sp.]
MLNLVLFKATTPRQGTRYVMDFRVIQCSLHLPQGFSTHSKSEQICDSAPQPRLVFNCIGIQTISWYCI